MAHVGAQPVLYGLTRTGGATDDGVLFAYYVASGLMVNEVDFSNVDRGRFPIGRLILGQDQRIYGCIEGGGGLGDGVLFEWDPNTGEFERRISFINTSLGRMPNGELIASGNTFFGLASRGGTSDGGTLFEYDPTTFVMVKRADFNGTGRGLYPIGGLTMGSGGKFFGLCKEGGTDNEGTLFEYDPATNLFIKRVDFNGASRGRQPAGRLLAASNGKLHGMTALGGSFGQGVLFSFNSVSLVFNKLLDLEAGSSGTLALGKLTEGLDGRIYGMNAAGGAFNDGVLFVYDPGDQTYTSILGFNDSLSGRQPTGTLLLNEDGHLYGMTRVGGLSGNGVLFRYDPGNIQFTKLADMQEQSLGRDAHGEMHSTPDGRIYGLTTLGGYMGAWYADPMGRQQWELYQVA